MANETPTSSENHITETEVTEYRYYNTKTNETVFADNASKPLGYYEQGLYNEKKLVLAQKPQTFTRIVGFPDNKGISR